MVRKASQYCKVLWTMQPVEYGWTRTFFETLPNKRLVKKNKSLRGGKQCKKRRPIANFVAADSSKPCNPVYGEANFNLAFGS